MGEKTKDIKAIFWQAVEKGNREEQLAYLEEACSDDKNYFLILDKLKLFSLFICIDNGNKKSFEKVL